jgi:deazaflavin-dependent oxidoreductase (nitroreductase family)
MLLDHVGVKSGRKRTVPLVYMPDGDDFVMVAAKGGYSKDPAWMHNLRANPDTEVQGRQATGQGSSQGGHQRSARSAVAESGRLQTLVGPLPGPHRANRARSGPRAE